MTRLTDADLALHAQELAGVGAWALWQPPGAEPDAWQLQWTAHAFRLHGLDPAAPQPSWPQALAMIEPADRDRVQDTLAAALRHGHGCDLHYGVWLPDGSLRPLHARAEPRAAAGTAGVPAGGALLVGALRALPGAVAPDPLLHNPLEYAVAAAGVGVWEVDVLTGQEQWSDTTLAIYGLPPRSTAPTRTQWRQHFLHPDDAERCAARAADFTATHRPYEMDYRIRRASDGAVRWLHSRAAFSFGGNRRVLGVTLDITERREAEAAAHEATLLLDHAALHVGFGFGWRAPGGEVGEWSPQLKRLFGLAPDAPTPGRSQLHQLIAEHDRERVGRQLVTPIQPGEVRAFSFDVKTGQNGRPRTLTTRAATVHDAEGTPRRTYFAVMDTTDMLQRERATRELLARLQLATEASGVGTWERDARTGVARWDDTMLGLWGLPPGSPAPTRQRYLALVHPEDRPAVAAAWRRPDDDRSPLDTEFRIVRPDGQTRWLRTRGRLEHGAGGVPLRRVGVCFDTTERREAEALQAARALAEQANAAKTEFLSRMSHELRTPLNAVLGFAQLMALDSADPLTPTQLARVGHVQAAGWHLLSLVNEVLDLSRIEARRSPIERAAVATGPLLTDCVAMAAPLAQAQGVAVTVRPTEPTAADATPVWADAARLKQVLVNLLSNAVKYNRAGGHVELCARCDTEHVVLAVRDNGLGMTTAQREQLFQPFNRLGRETSGIEGTGLGLAVCKLLVEQMGGRIEVDSLIGVGSEFRVVLPVPPPG